VDLKVSNLHRLLVAPPMPVERLDQIKLKLEHMFASRRSISA
jgi:hypothetical protein